MARVVGDTLVLHRKAWDKWRHHPMGAHRVRPASSALLLTKTPPPTPCVLSPVAHRPTPSPRPLTKHTRVHLLIKAFLLSRRQVKVQRRPDTQQERERERRGGDSRHPHRPPRLQAGPERGDPKHGVPMVAFRKGRRKGNLADEVWGGDARGRGVGDSGGGVGNGCWRSTGSPTEVRDQIKHHTDSIALFGKLHRNFLQRLVFFWQKLGTDQQEVLLMDRVQHCEKEKERSVCGWGTVIAGGCAVPRLGTAVQLQYAARTARGHFRTGARATAAVTLGLASPQEGVIALPTTAAALPVQREKMDALPY